MTNEMCPGCIPGATPHYVAASCVIRLLASIEALHKAWKWSAEATPYAAPVQARNACQPAPCNKNYRCDIHAGGSQHVNTSCEHTWMTYASSVPGDGPIRQCTKCASMQESQDGGEKDG